MEYQRTSQPKLIARWITVDGKLICKWVFMEEKKKRATILTFPEIVKAA